MAAQRPQKQKIRYQEEKHAAHIAFAGIGL